MYKLYTVIFQLTYNKLEKNCFIDIYFYYQIFSCWHDFENIPSIFKISIDLCRSKIYLNKTGNRKAKIK